jgi:hypothetical protein
LKSWPRILCWAGAYVLALALPRVAAGQEAAAPDRPGVEKVSFHRPDDATRFYHIRVELGVTDDEFVITSADVNGRAEAFVVATRSAGVSNGLERVDLEAVGRVRAREAAVVNVRCAWTNGVTAAVILHVWCARSGALSEIEWEGAAPASGGFPYPGWTEHRLLVLREDFGIERKDEPYVLFISDEAERVRTWAGELRVAAYDPASGATREIPSQVLYDKRRFDTPKQRKAYTTCQAAMLVDVPARGKSYYLIVYGNADTQPPQYPSDLKVSEREDGATWIENDYYEAQLDPKNNSIRGFRSKQFGVGAQRSFGFHDNPGLTLHYSPDVWVKNRPWTHARGWNPPPHHVMQQGPVAVVWRRWGHLPEAAEVEIDVTYRFFAKTPYVPVETTIDILEDVVVTALRNEELVFAPAREVTHAGWRELNGDVFYQPLSQGEGLQPGLVRILSPDAPYVCLAREDSGLGLASIRLKQHAGTRGAWPPVLASTATLIADYGWDFRYWTRTLVYPWGDHVSDDPVVLNADTYYGDTSAFCVFPIGAGDTPEARLAYVDRLHEALTQPIRIDHQGAGPW